MKKILWVSEIVVAPVGRCARGASGEPGRQWSTDDDDEIADSAMALIDGDALRWPTAPGSRTVDKDRALRHYQALVDQLARGGGDRGATVPPIPPRRARPAARR